VTTFDRPASFAVASINQTFSGAHIGQALSSFGQALASFRQAWERERRRRVEEGERIEEANLKNEGENSEQP